MTSKPWHNYYDYNVPTTIRYPRVAAHELLDLPTGAYPDKAALIFFGSEMTFYELRQESRRFANALAGLGIQKGDRVGVHLPNCPQYMIAYFAILSIGGNRRQPQSFIYSRRAQADGQYLGSDISCHL